nr:Uncharacterised protein [Escherichia coli]
MTTITREQAQAVSDLKEGYTLGHADVAILHSLARIALASLESKPVARTDEQELRDVEKDGCGYLLPLTRLRQTLTRAGLLNSTAPRQRR